MATLEEVVEKWEENEKMWNEKNPDFPIINEKDRKEYGKQVKTLDDKIAESPYNQKKYAKTSLSNKISNDKAHTICYTFAEDKGTFSIFFEKLPEYNDIDANSLYDFCKKQFDQKKIRGIPLKVWKKDDSGAVKLILNIPSNKSADFLVDCMKELILRTQVPILEFIKKITIN